MKERIHNFFENPSTKAAYGVQAFIILMVVLSVGILIIEFFYTPIFERYKNIFLICEYVILTSFTIEYVLRLLTAPKKVAFAAKPMSIVDFLAIAPGYLELLLPAFGSFTGTTAIRAVRIIRVLRFARILRVFKLFRYGDFITKVFRYQNTIFETITPVIVFFVALKAIIWGLESNNLWLGDANLGELFAIIGFALGIILSQKIGMSYDKFIQVEEAVARIYSRLHSLEITLNRIGNETATQSIKNWGSKFIELLENTKGGNDSIHEANTKFYDVIKKAEPVPADLYVSYSSIVDDAIFCLTKKVRLTPKAYDTLLHQATIVYLALIVVFIPTLTGMISVIVGTYTLYGMYKLTQDLDSIYGGEYNLINIDTSELRKFIKN